MFGGENADILLNALPPVVHIQNDVSRAAMRWYLERMMAILREPQPGHILLGGHLAQMVLIEILRLHTADTKSTASGWLFASKDRHIRSSLTAIHL